ncbi:H-NS histone family protein [Azonexus fungiphilus]|uniref:H-NS histone family protein n=1 Tax=Azonexus fungiphilus TaxID=146940 RepID=UPI00156B96FE|nr:H-NS histone family protein [Azonexus fungiphilus]NHC08359.1 H-NS histone family protein [Azonexus fungiphilus]
MATLAELKAQKDALEAQIAEAIKTERKDAIAQVRELIAAFELTEKEVFAKKRGAKSTVAAKYKNPQTGETWTGRGRTPKWLAGKNKEDFAI